jgi:hypothetical protein
MRARFHVFESKTRPSNTGIIELTFSGPSSTATTSARDARPDPGYRRKAADIRELELSKGSQKEERCLSIFPAVMFASHNETDAPP